MSNERVIRKYQGFGMDSKPYRLADSGEWKIKVDIMKETDDGNLEYWPILFPEKETYETEEEAYEQGLEMAAKLIDGSISSENQKLNKFLGR